MSIQNCLAEAELTRRQHAEACARLFQAVAEASPLVAHRLTEIDFNAEKGGAYLAQPDMLDGMSLAQHLARGNDAAVLYYLHPPKLDFETWKRMQGI